MRRLSLAAVILAILLHASTLFGQTKEAVVQPLKGPYLGQTPPGKTPAIFAPGVVSTEAHEFSCSLTPDGTEFYFARKHPALNQTVVMWTRFRDGVWTEPEVVPFVDTPVAELQKYRAVIHTALGDIRLAFYPQDAPEHVRQFLRFAKLGLYDGTTFLRVVPGFVLQGGLMDTRKPPVPDKYQPLLKPLKAEFNQHKHVRGILSMARTDDPNSGMDSFFIVLDTQPHLDGQYTAFGFVEVGMEVVDAIVARPVSGETPVDPVPLTVEVRER